MTRSQTGTALAAGLFCLFFSCSQTSGPLAPYTPDDPDDQDEKSWQEVLAEDPSYPDNVYLTEFVDWEPGTVGASRRSADYTDSEGRPLKKFTADALGPPEGSGSGSSGSGLTCPVGINGWAVWKFDPRYVIVDGPGDDFVTFAKTFAWGRTADRLCCELAHVEVSPDGSTWYVLPEELVEYDVNQTPSVSSNKYIYRNVKNLHGNAPTWANFRRDMQAETLANIDGVERWEDLPDVTVSRYFEATEDRLGGTSFDLADFHLKGDESTPWPADGKMKYLKIIDDDTILDGQDYDKAWCLGANLMSAMGINTRLAE